MDENKNRNLNKGNEETMDFQCGYALFEYSNAYFGTWVVYIGPESKLSFLTGRNLGKFERKQDIILNSCPSIRIDIITAWAPLSLLVSLKFPTTVPVNSILIPTVSWFKGLSPFVLFFILAELLCSTRTLTR